LEWTKDERGKEAIRLKVEERFSAGLISRRLNAMPGEGQGTITRNAVTGFLWRRGVAGTGKGPTKSIRQKKICPRPRAAPKRATTVRSPLVYGRDIAGVTAHGAADNNSAAELAAPSPERQAILITNDRGRLAANDHLTEHSCRWPVGDPRSPDFHFCGRKKVVGPNGMPLLPYCTEHAKRAFQQPDPQKTDNFSTRKQLAPV
jgi:GcrA cell cycle regulator